MQDGGRQEWFLQGTEQATAPGEESPGFHIAYPATGTIIAIDPDIPLRHQRVQFNSKGAADVAWTIDGGSIGNGLDIGWAPTGGRHKLVLTDLQGNELDSVSFEVRGALPP